MQGVTPKDTDLTIRFKQGTHTVFLFVDPMSTFGEVASELLLVLQERYPDGLASGAALPDDASRIEFAAPKNASDPALGWKPLDAGATETLASKGIKDNMMVAFAFREEDAAVGDVEFLVDFPTYDDEGEEQDEEEEEEEA